MTATETTSSVVTFTPTRHYSPFAAFLSYLIPGLGQIYQGRIGKGLLFLICLYGLFFYGMHLSQWNNVYLPAASERAGGFKINGPSWLRSIVNDRLAFAGQFWIGIAAWPAIWHHSFDYNYWDSNYNPQTQPPPSWPAWVFWQNSMRTPPESPEQVQRVKDEIGQLGSANQARLTAWIEGWEGRSLNEMQAQADKSWDLGLICTVIAGVLNILVIYDAFAGPALVGIPVKPEEEKSNG